MAKKLPALDDVCQQITQEEAGKLLGWQESTLQTFLNDKQFKLSEEWRWIKGVVYFQVTERGNITYNRYALSMWQIARSQDDASIYLNAIARFQEVVRAA